MGRMILFSVLMCAGLLTVQCAVTATEEPNAVQESDFYTYLQARTDEPPVDDEDFNKVAEVERRGAGGVSYIRWGRTDCGDDADLVYSGRAAGSFYGHSGGGSNYQCITLRPKNFNFGPGTVSASYIYGAEYEVWGNVPKASLHLHEHDVPCAVCYVPTRTAKIMIPGTYKCPRRWTREYFGYLMAERHNHHRSTFECVDKDAEKAISGHANHNGALFYFVEPRCGSLPCPPYDQQKEMTCAVCTR